MRHFVIVENDADLRLADIADQAQVLDAVHIPYGVHRDIGVFFQVLQIGPENFNAVAGLITRHGFGHIVDNRL
ncbi:hypothetical protein D3C87_1822440 [compost metagenome]